LNFAIRVVFMPLAFACQSIFAVVANEYIDKLLQYVRVFVNHNELSEVNIGDPYFIGDWTTIYITRDVSLDCDLHTGGITMFDSLRLEILCVSSSDGREISFGPNNFHGNVELILAAEPEIQIHEFRTESLICEECGQDISINFPKTMQWTRAMQ
jgi:hypothetical protein